MQSPLLSLGTRERGADSADLGDGYVTGETPVPYLDNPPSLYQV